MSFLIPFFTAKDAKATRRISESGVGQFGTGKQVSVFGTDSVLLNFFAKVFRLSSGSSGIAAVRDSVIFNAEGRRGFAEDAEVLLR
jgi:hypothetical protein